jgi:hypothetical protein
MADKRVTRRAALKAGAGGGLLTALAGCLDSKSNGNGDSPSGDGSLDAVPSGATAVVYFDMDRLLDDEMVREGFNRVLEILQQQRSGDLPVESYKQALSMVESEVGFDPRGLRSMQLFFGDETGSASGLLFEADWSEDEIVDAIESQGQTLTSRSEGGHTIYSDEEGSDGLVALEDGRYLLAESATIESVLSVLAGKADPAGGRLADAYADTSGMVRFAADVSETDLSDGNDLSAMDDVSIVSGSLTASGNTRTLSADLTLASSDSASQLAGQIDTALSRARSQVDQYPEIQEMIENPRDHLDAVEVSQSGSTVTVTYGGSAELVGEGGMVVLGAVVASFMLGLGQSTSNPYPQAAFAWDYYASAEAVTITHQSGDTIEGSNLSVRGSTGNGTIDRTWTDYGVEEVTAGTSVTVENVTDSFELDIVWVDDSDSAILSSFAGPDA